MVWFVSDHRSCHILNMINFFGNHAIIKRCLNFIKLFYIRMAVLLDRTKIISNINKFINEERCYI